MENEPLSTAVSLRGSYSALQEMLKGSAGSNDFFHYTSTEVLDKILSTACFRATNIYYLNDSMEYLEGLKKLMSVVQGADTPNQTFIDCINELRYSGCNMWEGLYTISFSTKEDNLQHWITYAKESGVCIQLDGEIMTRASGAFSEDDEQKLIFIQKDRTQKTVGEITSGNCLNPIDYGEPMITLSQLEESFKHYYLSDHVNADVTEHADFWENNRDILKRFLQLTASFFKIHDFDGEYEARLSFFPLVDDTDEESETNNSVEFKYHRMPSGALRPYINIYFLQAPEKHYACPIRSITIGPGGHQQVVFDSVVHRLKYGDCKLWQYGLKKKAECLSEYISLCTGHARKLLEQDTGDSEQSDIESLLKNLTNYLQDEWAYRAECKVIVDRAGKLSLTQKEDGDSPVRPKIPEDAKTMLLLEKVLSEFFLSSSGVIVRKSACPYIF